MHDEYCIVLCVPENLRWSLYEYLPSQKTTAAQYIYFYQQKNNICYRTSIWCEILNNNYRGMVNGLHHVGMLIMILVVTPFCFARESSLIIAQYEKSLSFAYSHDNLHDMFCTIWQHSKISILIDWFYCDKIKKPFCQIQDWMTKWYEFLKFTLNYNS